MLIGSGLGGVVGPVFAPAAWTDDLVKAAQPAIVPRAYWSDGTTGKIVGWDPAPGVAGQPLQYLCGHLGVWDGTTRTTIAFDADFFTAGAMPAARHFYSTPVGLFISGVKGNNLVLSRIKDWADATTTRCTTGGVDFGVDWKLGQNGAQTLPRSLVYVPPTTGNADGIVLWFEYAGSSTDPTACKVMYSLDKGATWALLFTASSAIRHFHGGKWVPATAANGLASPGRLYVFTGDGPLDPVGHPEQVAAALLFCDDIDDLIANPETWKTNWGLDGLTQNQIVPDPDYCMNDNLHATLGYPTNQKFRIVDVADNGGDSLVWSQDGSDMTDRPMFRTHHLTKVTTRIGTTKVYNSGWNSIIRDDGSILWFTCHEANAGVGQSDAAEFMWARCYHVSRHYTRIAQIRAWEVPTAASGLAPQHAFEAFGRAWVQFDGAGEKRLATENYSQPANIQFLTTSYSGPTLFSGALNVTPATPVLTELFTDGIPATMAAPWAAYGTPAYTWAVEDGAGHGMPGRVLVVGGEGSYNAAYVRKTAAAWQKKFLTVTVRAKLVSGGPDQTAYLKVAPASGTGVAITLTTAGGHFDDQWHDYQFTIYSGESYVDLWFFNNYTAGAVPGAVAMYVADIRVVEGIVPKPRTA